MNECFAVTAAYKFHIHRERVGVWYERKDLRLRGRERFWDEGAKEI